MRRTFVCLQAIDTNTLRKGFVQTFTRLWQKAGSPAQVGLAISGGVDSMALASLCRDYLKEFPDRLQFTGLIVDHGLRRESGIEAVETASALSALNIPSRILEIDWTNQSHHRYSQNIETIARRRRYQILGKVCYQLGTDTLMLGHHADDQAETVMARMIADYHGSGLRGMQGSAHIPECEGLYGVDESGRPEALAEGLSRLKVRPGKGMLVEDGGVKIHRPLLGFTKAELTALCRDADVRWREDATNSDKTFTVRNTIRYAQNSGALPRALRSASLLRLSAKQAERWTNLQTETEAMIKQMSFNLDLRFGKANVTIPYKIMAGERSVASKDFLRASLCRELLLLVSPNTQIALQDLGKMVDYIFGEKPVRQKDHTERFMAIQVCGVTVRQGEVTDESRAFTLCRQIPRRFDAGKYRAYFHPASHAGSRPFTKATSEQSRGLTSEWMLWDERYWMRLRNWRETGSTAQHRVYVDFLRPETLGELRKSLDDKTKEDLSELLAQGFIDLRWTIPMLAAGPEILALPSLGWWRHDLWAQQADGSWHPHAKLRCDIRFRRINYGHPDMVDTTTGDDEMFAPAM